MTNSSSDRVGEKGTVATLPWPPGILTCVMDLASWSLCVKGNNL